MIQIFMTPYSGSRALALAILVFEYRVMRPCYALSMKSVTFLVDTTGS